jgi:hypothetical protein
MKETYSVSGFSILLKGKLKAPNPLSYGFTIQRKCNTNPHLAPVRNAWHPEGGCISWNDTLLCSHIEFLFPMGLGWVLKDFLIQTLKKLTARFNVLFRHICGAKLCISSDGR